MPRLMDDHTLVRYGCMRSRGIPQCPQLPVCSRHRRQKASSPQLPNGMRAAPKFVFIYTVAGIAGSVLALLQITILLAVFVTQGLKARSLQRLCPIAVHFQYYSGFLQLLSMSLRGLDFGFRR